jgi:SOS response regulatory protein OraA/RecX
MKIKEQYKVREMAGEHVIIMQGKHGSDLTKIISLNESALYLWGELCGKEFDVESVASLLVERGYVNDARLAERYAETFYVFKNMGLKKIRNELYRRGISSDDIENALSKYETEDQSDRIEEFVRKKYDISRLDDANYRRKVYAGAMRAGFSSGDVCDFLRNFESE